MSMGLMDKAESYFARSREISEELGDCAGTGYALHNMALIAMYRGDMAAVHSLMDASMPILKTHAPAGTLADITYNMALSAIHREDFEYARQMLNEGLNQESILANRAQSARLLAARGYLEARMGKSVEAEVTYLSALELFRSIEDKQRMASMLSAVARLYVAKGSYALAVQALDEALLCAAEVSDRHLVATILLARAQVDRHTGERQKCLQRLSRAADIVRHNSEKLLSLQVLLEAFNLLSEPVVRMHGPSIAYHVAHIIEEGNYPLDATDRANLQRLPAASASASFRLESRNPHSLMDYVMQLARIES